MRGLRILMLILLAAVFAVGGPLRALPCHAEPVAPPSCHEMVKETPDHMAGMVMTPDRATDKAPAHKPRSDLMALSCCAGCLPASVRDIAPTLAPAAAIRIAFASLDQAFDGLSLAPDHDPPRRLA